MDKTSSTTIAEDLLSTLEGLKAEGASKERILSFLATKRAFIQRDLDNSEMGVALSRFQNQRQQLGELQDLVRQLKEKWVAADLGEGSKSAGSNLLKIAGGIVDDCISKLGQDEMGMLSSCWSSAPDVSSHFFVTAPGRGQVDYSKKASSFDVQYEDHPRVISSIFGNADFKPGSASSPEELQQALELLRDHESQIRAEEIEQTEAKSSEETPLVPVGSEPEPTIEVTEDLPPPTKEEVFLLPIPPFTKEAPRAIEAVAAPIAKTGIPVIDSIAAVDAMIQSGKLAISRLQSEAWLEALSQETSYRWKPRDPMRGYLSNPRTGEDSGVGRAFVWNRLEDSTVDCSFTARLDMIPEGGKVRLRLWFLVSGDRKPKYGGSQRLLSWEELDSLHLNPAPFVRAAFSSLD